MSSACFVTQSNQGEVEGCHRAVRAMHTLQRTEAATLDQRRTNVSVLLMDPRADYKQVMDDVAMPDLPMMKSRIFVDQQGEFVS